MRRIIEYFERTYIINLRDRADRRRGVVHEFESVGLSVPNAQVKFYTADRFLDAAGFPSIGVRGSFSSHQRVLELALEENARNLLVVEDDVLFKRVSKHHEDVLIRFLAQDDWDLMYFGYGQPADALLKGPVDPWSGPTIGGHFYAVNRDFMEKMAVYMAESQKRPSGSPLGGPTFRDGAYNDIRARCPQIQTFLSVPNLAGQRSSRTDLHPLRFYDRHRLFHPIVELLRQIKTKIHRAEL